MREKDLTDQIPGQTPRGESAGKSGAQRILLVEDTPALARTYMGYLRQEPYEIQHVETGKAALAALAEAPPQAVLLDLKLPDMDGLEVLRRLRADGIACPVVVITAHGSLTVAVESMRDGASDFIVKPFSADRLKVTLANLLEKQELVEIVQTYQEKIDRRSFEGFIGSSLAMQSVYQILEGAAASKATVFVTGESGTGKELCAQAVHNRSPRSKLPFIALNCAAIPKDLIESEIFGHVKGAFTGAIANREGAASQADGGTLFLDEICEMDPGLQSKLLRFIQTGTFQKVGSSKTETVDIRFVCATNRDPLEEVRAGRFREDLYYRLHVIPVALPPLRARGGDVMEIGSHLLETYVQDEGKSFSGFDAEAEMVISTYRWPGNVREMENVIRNVVVLNDGTEVTAAMLPPNLTAPESPAPQAAADPAAPLAPAAAPKAGSGDIASLAREIRPLAEVEKETIQHAVALCGGDVRKAAVLLDIGPATIYRKRKAWGEG